MKTYIRLKFSSKGARPSEVYDIMKKRGFAPAIGEYDFVYDWGESGEPDEKELIAKLDYVHNSLMGHEVAFEVTTSDPMYYIKELPSQKMQNQQAVPPKAGPPSAAQQRSSPTTTPSSESGPTPLKGPVGEIKCPTCGQQPRYVMQYHRWYCLTCKKYL